MIKRKRLRFNPGNQEEADNDEVQNISMVRGMQKDYLAYINISFSESRKKPIEWVVIKMSEITVF